MRTIVFDIKNPADGDLIIIEYASPLGGCTNVKTKVLGPRVRPVLDGDGFATSTENVPAQTPREIAAILAHAINNEWMKEAFEAKVKPDTGSLIINNPMTLTPDVQFRAVVSGNGGTKVDVTEF